MAFRTYELTNTPNCAGELLTPEEEGRCFKGGDVSRSGKGIRGVCRKRGRLGQARAVHGWDDGVSSAALRGVPSIHRVMHTS